MEAANSAFLSKLTWKLFHEQNLWVEQMKAKYQINENFFSIHSKKFDSWAWKCILINRHQFHKGIRWKVGDGTKIHFLLDNCCANASLVTMLAIIDISLIDTSLMVSQYITDAKEWDVMKLKVLVDDVHLQLILATHIPSSTIFDSVCCGPSGNGDFSIKTTTSAAHELDFKNSPSWECNWIWHLDITPKLKVFLWQLCHASLPTKGAPLNRGLQIDPICPLYHTEIEDVELLARFMTSFYALICLIFDSFSNIIFWFLICFLYFCS